MRKKEIKRQVKEFLKDSSKRKLVLEVPSGFSLYWVRNPISVLLRRIALLLLSKVPPMRIKTWLFRVMGYDFKKDVCLPGYIHIDEYFPELIHLEEGVLVGGMAVIKPWVLEGNKLTLGRINIARRVLLAGWSTILPGANIHENVITGIKCRIDSEIPKNSFVIKHNEVIKKWSKEELERHFGESKHDPNYARKVRELTKRFRKDKNLRHIRFRNDGNRLNAGCDWWRARPVWRIYYNGILVELAVLCPFESIRKALYWLMGVRFGKNFRIGKRVYFDHIYGDMVRLGDNVTLEDDVFMDAHEYTAAETVYAKTVVGNNVLIKKGTWVRGGSTIGNNVVIEENSAVMKDIPDNEVWGGSPAKFMRKKS
jgi:acetyltransferase-like isoleucine patch superfamily enzyme